MKDTVRDIIRSSASLAEAMSKDSVLQECISKAADQLQKTVRVGGTIYTCGNGGSTCDAMHFVEELVARFKRERPGIRAMHFMDSSTLTCWANDYAFESVFERQVQTFCTAKDTLVAFSTSGNSQNVVRAVEAAKRSGTFCIGLTNQKGGKLATIVDLPLQVPTDLTERAQEAHIVIVHILCELLDCAR